eukprot:TRINITY_DN111136_c0_g1_i1.p1 TRINITY_DN111136_c0_g1~~TRINITY_DN111136_c0_g1_i1.p1  ORF type:complete len:1041 (-),score=187.18 TRINITY_DN111136_c0_g1_i1:295-3417(-)
MSLAHRASVAALTVSVIGYLLFFVEVVHVENALSAARTQPPGDSSLPPRQLEEKEEAKAPKHAEKKPAPAPAPTTTHKPEKKHEEEEKSVLEEEHDIGKAFRVPPDDFLETQCNLNTSNFVPSCLPKAIYKRKSVDDWMFTQLCGVEAGAVRVSNVENKKDVHAEIFRLLYDNLIVSCTAWVAGMASTGLFLLKREKKQDAGGSEEHTSTSCVEKFEQLLAVCTTGSAVYFALAATLTCFLRFWGECVEFVKGVAELNVQYHCKSMMWAEVLYYKDLLGYLTLGTFSLSDVITLASMFCVQCGLQSNLCCQALWHPLSICFTWIWKMVCCCGCFWSWLACIKAMFVECWSSFVHCITCQPCIYCCRFLKGLIIELWGKFVSLLKAIWAFLSGGLCKMVVHFFEGIGNLFKVICWKISYYCSHCAYLCCCNFFCRDCCVILGLALSLVAAVVLVPLLFYLAAGLMVYGFCMAISIAFFTALILTVFYTANLTWTAITKAKETVTSDDQGTQFATPGEFYGLYLKKIVDDISKSWNSSTKVSLDDPEELAKEEPDIPAEVTWAQAVGSTATKDQRVFAVFCPVAIVLLLIFGGNIISGSNRVLGYVFLSRDLEWAACSDEHGMPMKCPKAADAYQLANGKGESWEIKDLKAHGGHLPEFAKSQLLDVNGVLVPPDWPVISDAVGCKCLRCEDSSPASHAEVCGPLNIPNSPDPAASCGAFVHPDQTTTAPPKQDKPTTAAPKKDTTTTAAPKQKEHHNRRLHDTKEHNITESHEPDGLGKHGTYVRGPLEVDDVVLCKYTGTYSHFGLSPVILNTFKLKTKNPPKPGCYGARFMSSLSLMMDVDGNRLDGWCNCSSGRFVPTAYDERYLSHTVLWMRGPWHESDTGVDTFSSAHTQHTAPWKQSYIDAEERQTMEWETLYGADPTLGFHVYAPYRSLFDAINDLFHHLFMDVLGKYMMILVTSFGVFWAWLTDKFFSAVNLKEAATGFLQFEAPQSFEEVQDSVLLARSIASYMMGVAAFLQMKKRAATTNGGNQYEAMRQV